MRTTIVIASFFVSLTSGWGDQNFDQLLRQGRAAYDNSDIRKAESSWLQACPPGLNATADRMKFAYCEHNLAILDEAKGRLAEAEQRYRRALAEFNNGGDIALPARTLTLMNLGELYRRHHRNAEAETLLREAVESARRAGKACSWELPAALSRLGGVYGESEDPERGRPFVVEAIDRFGKLADPQPAELGYAYDSVGMIDLATGHVEEGEANLRKAVSLAAASLGEDHIEAATYQTNLALALILRGQPARAEVLLRRARLIVEKRQGPSERLGIIVAELSTAAMRQNKFAMAEDYARQSVSILKLQPEPDEIRIALANVNLASIYLREKKPEEAGNILPDAISTERKYFASGRMLADGIRCPAELRSQQRLWKESDLLYREAIGLYESKSGARSNELGPILREYADVRKHNGGSKQEIKSLESRARAISAGATT